MALSQQIDQDLIEAMKSKDETRVSTLRMFKSALHNWQIAKHATKKEPQDADAISVIQKEIKSRQDSIAMYQKGGRADLAAKEEGEIEILKKYLPEQMSEQEIRAKVKGIISSVDAKGPQDLGKVMGPLMTELEARADGATCSRIVKEELGDGN